MEVVAALVMSGSTPYARIRTRYATISSVKYPASARFARSALSSSIIVVFRFKNLEMKAKVNHFFQRMLSLEVAWMLVRDIEELARAMKKIFTNNKKFYVEGPNPPANSVSQVCE